MTKNILLAATAASVMAFAGAASAHTLTFRGATAGAIDSTEVGANGYRLAQEAIASASGTFALAADLTGTATFPSGNNRIIIDLNGGTFSSALTSANVSATNCTTVLSSGGAVNDSTATFLISSSGAGCETVDIINLPVKANAGSNVWVRTTLQTEAGSAIDPDTAQTQPAGNPFGTLAGNQEAIQLIDRVNAFRAVIDGAIGGGALTDTFATLTTTPVYTTFFVGTGGHTAPETSTVGQLGTMQIIVDTSAYRDMNLNAVAAADVQDADVVVTGNFTAFNAALSNVQLGGANATTITAGQSTLDNRQAALTSGAAQTFRVTADGDAIPSSDYSATITYALNSTFYVQDAPVTGALERIGRDGTNVVLPWMNSNAIQAVSGSTNIVRVGNTGAVTGPVFAQVLNSTSAAAGYTPATGPVQLFANVPANGERLITTAILTAAVGDFGRGDVQISIEAPSNTITVRRFATLANGDVTELTPGTVASDQNQVNVP